MSKLPLHLLIFWQVSHLLWTKHLELDLDRSVNWDSDTTAWFHKHPVVRILLRHLATYTSVWLVGQGQIALSWRPFCHMDSPQKKVNESEQVHHSITNSSKRMPCEHDSGSVWTSRQSHFQLSTFFRLASLPEFVLPLAFFCLTS